MTARETLASQIEAADELVCANCKGLFADLEEGREPEELCPTCWHHAEQNLAAAVRAGGE